MTGRRDPRGTRAGKRRMASLAVFVAGVSVLGGAATAAVTDYAADAGADDDAQNLLVLASAAVIATFALVFHALLIRPADPS